MNVLATSSTPQNDEKCDLNYKKPVLKVIGMGGGGCNAVNRMIELGLKDVDFIAANTDRQALLTSVAPTKLQLGPVLTRGLGAGGQPEIGEAAAMESMSSLKEILSGADMVFVTAGMGGGTGTGSIAIAAEIARAAGAVTVGIVTTPFSFEVGRRQRNATSGLKRLASHCDTLIAISNDRLMQVRGGNITIDLAFRVADDVLRQAVQGVTELVTESGFINVDFAHIKRLMKMGGGAFLAIGQGEGEGKAVQAVQNALKHPLLESVSLQDAAGVLVNFTGGQDLTFHEVTQAFSYLQNQAGSNLEVVMGMVNDERMVNRAQAILIVTGIGAQAIEEVLPGAEALSSQKAPAQKISQETPVAVVQPTLVQQPLEAPIPSLPQQLFRQPTDWAQTPISSAKIDQQVADNKDWSQALSKAGRYESEALIPADNLDIPAFLRRRKPFAFRGENLSNNQV